MRGVSSGSGFSATAPVHMEWSFTEVVLSSLALGVIVHALLLGRYVASREPATSQTTAIVIIFFSGMWYIGPFTYFGFKNKRPLLARACLRQMIAVTALWVAWIVVRNFSANF